ncbi:metal ABC transporter permease [Canibacter sp. lx-72]|uniref:metal ABC transporter permease n=1 Tax=Canibacter zhuwentaonis TaxID=2837491 RepID=UPI001BDC6144|nr:metal ABC transporter permease [Canibacter zhuwentaonis]MBT1018576.1 metal ABC transporter permease [Canibacter zhuwentaonis]
MNWQDFIAVMGLPFAQRALLTLALLAFGSGIVGVFVSLRGLEFMTDGLVHAIFPGLVIGYILGGSTLLLGGALTAALVTVVLISLLKTKNITGSDTAIAITLSAAFSLGIVLVSKQKNYVSALENLLFGNVLTVTTEQLLTLTVAVALALLIIALTWRAQLYLAFDPQGFKASGYRANLTNLALGCAIALLVVAGAGALGNLLVIALVIVPTAAARQLSKKLLTLIPIAIIVTLIAGFAGLSASVWVSFALDAHLSAGAATVIALVLLYLAAIFYKQTTARLKRLRGGLQ